MKKLFLKYKINIILCLLLVAILLFLKPNEEKYYLKIDIEKFQNDYYWLIIATIIILISAILAYTQFKKIQVKEILLGLLNTTIIIIIYSFLLQNVIMTLLLLGNRTIDRNQKTIIYKVEYNEVNDYTKIINQTKTDTITNIWEEKIINRLNIIRKNQKLKSINESDTIHIKYNNGLFGVKYLAK